jgi:hypothetical protein
MEKNYKLENSFTDFTDDEFEMDWDGYCTHLLSVNINVGKKDQLHGDC